MANPNKDCYAMSLLLMPPKKTSGSKSTRVKRVGIKAKLLKELRSKRKSAKKELREIERDIRSLSGRKRNTK